MSDKQHNEEIDNVTGNVKVSEAFNNGNSTVITALVTTGIVFLGILSLVAYFLFLNYTTEHAGAAESPLAGLLIPLGALFASVAGGMGVLIGRINKNEKQNKVLLSEIKSSTVQAEKNTNGNLHIERERANLAIEEVRVLLEILKQKDVQIGLLETGSNKTEAQKYIDEYKAAQKPEVN